MLSSGSRHGAALLHVQAAAAPAVIDALTSTEDDHFATHRAAAADGTD